MQTRDEIQARIETLRAERGKCVLDGRKFDDAALEAAERDLAALDDAGAEKARRDREVAQAEHTKCVAALKASLRAEIANYLEAVRRAETASRQAAEAIAQALEGAKAMARLAHQLGAKAVPIPISARETENRMGCRHAAVMATAGGHNAHRLGPVEWPVTHYRADQSWQDSEAALLTRHVAPLTQ
jgi:hypothetical protein